MQHPHFHRVRRFVGLPLEPAALLMISSAVAAAVAGLFVFVLGLITELLLFGGNTGDNVFADFLRKTCGHGATIDNPLVCFSSLLLVWLVLAMIEAVALYCVYRAARQIALAAAARLRTALHAQALILGPGGSWTTRGSTPEALFCDTIETIRQGLVSWWQTLPLDLLLVVSLLGLAMGMHFWLSLAVIVLVAACWPLLDRLRKNARQREAILADRAAKQRSLLAESLQQARWIDGASPTNQTEVVFQQQLAHHQRTAGQQESVASRAEPTSVFLLLVCVIFIVFLVGFNVLRDPPRITPAETNVMVVALAAAYLPLQRLLRLSASLDDAERASTEIGEYLDRPPGIRTPPGLKDIAPLRQRLDLAGVTIVDHTGHKLLDSVSLSLPVGSRTALVTTDAGLPPMLAELFPRCYDPAAGQVTIDGADIRSVTLESLRKEVALIRCEDWLTTATVTENIGGGSYSAEQVGDAARQAGAYDFIQRLPQGFDTVVGEHGIRISSDECFRLAVAHALLRDPSLVILAEPEENVDSPPDHPLDDAVAAISENRTVLALARRMSTLRAAQRVILVHEGKIYAEGTHADLLQRNDLYRHVNYVRFNEFRGVS